MLVLRARRRPLLARVSAEGALSLSVTYNAQGTPLTRTDALGGVTRWEYDAYGNRTKEIDALGHERSFAYDANGRLLSETTTRTTPSGLETLVTSYRYDKSGRLMETTLPDGSTTRNSYDGTGMRVESFDPLNRRTSYTYDSMSRPTVTTFPDGTTEDVGYDAEGRKTSSKDRAGRETRYEHDPHGRPTKTTYPDGTFTTNAYDDAGRLIATTNARGKATRYEYDAAGRKTKVIDAKGQQTLFTYDAAGNMSSAKDPKGRLTIYEYDDLDRLVRTAYPDGREERIGYDALGRRVSRTDRAGRTTLLDYDKLGRLVTVTDAKGQQTRFEYDEVGNRIKQIDAEGRTTTFEYDKRGRQTKRILPGGKSETKSYDGAGNLKTRIDFMGRTTTYEHHPSNDWVTRRSDPDGSSTSFTYTPVGRLAAVLDARGTTTYGYDLRDRLASVVAPDGGGLGYEYDGEGNRTKLAASVGGKTLVTTWGYDDLNRPVSVTDPQGGVYALTYDPNGNRESLTYPNGVRTSYGHDELDRLTGLTTTHAPSGRLVQSYLYELGPAGHRQQITEGDGTVREHVYDELHRLTGERVTVSGLLHYEKSFALDKVGNRLSQITNGSGAPGTPAAPGTITYSYDNRDRLLTAGGRSFTYDDNGNLITASGEASYVWSFEDRLVRVTKGDGTVVEHVYDPFGVRVQTKTTPPGGPAAVTDYLVDASGGLSHVVAETDGTGALQAYYVRVRDELLAVIRPSGTKYVHTDGLGSVRRLTDANGMVTDGWSYTAHGEVYGRTGTDPLPYGFAGEPFDPQVGWAHHRARWMDPALGRFSSMDSFPGIPLDPRTLHRYVYAAADPVNNTDPSGLLFSNFIYGRMVHAAIGTHFTAPTTSPNDRLSDRTLNTILRTNLEWFGSSRPDLVDRTTTEVFEIKPWGSYVMGQVQLEFYLSILNTQDPEQRTWTRGSATSYTPPPTIPLGWGVVARVEPVDNGVILYEVTDYKDLAIITMVIIASSMNSAALGANLGVASTNVLMGRVA